MKSLRNVTQVFPSLNVLMVILVSRIISLQNKSSRSVAGPAISLGITATYNINHTVSKAQWNTLEISQKHFNIEKTSNNWKICIYVLGS